jgi:hypothetical protein
MDKQKTTACELERISRRHLEELAGRVSERDKAILQSLQKCRYLTTHQIQRLCFTDSVTPAAALRAANRGLAKLQAFGLIGTLKRRIGGARAGSGAAVRYITDAGLRLLNIDHDGEKSRKRFFEPSIQFLSHTLAVAESYLQLTELCAKHGAELLSVELEPVC